MVEPKHDAEEVVVTEDMNTPESTTLASEPTGSGIASTAIAASVDDTALKTNQNESMKGANDNNNNTNGSKDKDGDREDNGQSDNNSESPNESDDEDEDDDEGDEDAQEESAECEDNEDDVEGDDDVVLVEEQQENENDQEEDEDEDEDEDEGQQDDDDDDDDESHDNKKSQPKQKSILIHAPTGGVDAVDFPLSNIKNHLICPLCKGYFRDPYTVADCLHSFCRSCLILTFRLGHRRCPTCNTSLEPDPFREVLADRTLQEVVDKIFPWMKTKEEKEEREFYARRGIVLKPEYAEDANSPEKKKQKTATSTTTKVTMKNKKGGKGVEKSGGEEDGDSGGKASSAGGEGSSLHISSPAQATMNDQLDLQLEPDECKANIMQRMPPLNNPSLRTSGRLKIKSIKKYLLQKLGLRDTPSAVEVLCNGDPIGEELSLTFILRTRWFNPNKILKLNYRLTEEFAAAQRGNNILNQHAVEELAS